MYKRIALVNGTKTQLQEEMPAEELFSESGLFRNVRDYVKVSEYDAWFILTPFYGLVHPDQVIKPHDLKLSAKRRAGWAVKVAKQLKEFIDQQGWAHEQLCFDLFVGYAVAKVLVKALRDIFGNQPKIDRPIAGRGRIGQIRSWLVDQTEILKLRKAPLD